METCYPIQFQGETDNTQLGRGVEVAQPLPQAQPQTEVDDNIGGGSTSEVVDEGVPAGVSGQLLQDNTPPQDTAQQSTPNTGLNTPVAPESAEPLVWRRGRGKRTATKNFNAYDRWEAAGEALASTKKARGTSSRTPNQKVVSLSALTTELEMTDEAVRLRRERREKIMRSLGLMPPIGSPFAQWWPGDGPFIRPTPGSAPMLSSPYA